MPSEATQTEGDQTTGLAETSPQLPGAAVQHARRSHHGHKEPFGVREHESGLELPAQIVIKTQEIRQMREEANGVEAKLLHDQEVLQIKEHELGVLEGRLLDAQNQAAKNKEEGVAHWVVSTRS